MSSGRAGPRLGQLGDQRVQALGEDARRGGGSRRSRAGRGRRFFSTISCAIRTSVRRMSSRSRTTVCGLQRAPSWPHGTGLKGLGSAAAYQRPTAGDSVAARRATGIGLARLPSDPSGPAPARPAPGTGSRSRRSRAGARSVEDRARLVVQHAGVVAGREVVERQQPDLRVARDAGGLGGGRVTGLVRALASSSRTSPRGSAGRRRARRPATCRTGACRPR